MSASPTKELFPSSSSSSSPSAPNGNEKTRSVYSDVSTFPFLPKRFLVAVFTSLGLLLSTVIQTNFSISNSLILNPTDSKDVTVSALLSLSRPRLLSSPLLSLSAASTHPLDIDRLGLSQFDLLRWLYSLSHSGGLPGSSLLSYEVTFDETCPVARHYRERDRETSRVLLSSRMFLLPLFTLFLLNMLMPLAISALPSTYKLNYYLTGLLRLIQGVCAVRHLSSPPRVSLAASDTGLRLSRLSRHSGQLVSAVRAWKNGRIHLHR